MKLPGKHEFIVACSLANNQGWQNFSRQIFQQVCRKGAGGKNIQLHKFLISEIKRLNLKGYDVKVVKECLALVIESMKPLPKISYTTISELKEELYVHTSEEKNRLVDLKKRRGDEPDELEMIIIKKEEQEIQECLKVRKKAALRKAELFFTQEMGELNDELCLFVSGVCGRDYVLYDSCFHMVYLLIALVMRSCASSQVKKQIDKISGITY